MALAAPSRRREDWSYVEPWATMTRTNRTARVIACLCSALGLVPALATGCGSPEPPALPLSAPVGNVPPQADGSVVQNVAPPASTARVPGKPTGDLPEAPGEWLTGCGGLAIRWRQLQGQPTPREALLPLVATCVAFLRSSPPDAVATFSSCMKAHESLACLNPIAPLELFGPLPQDAPEEWQVACDSAASLWLKSQGTSDSREAKLAPEASCLSHLRTIPPAGADMMVHCLLKTPSAECTNAIGGLAALAAPPPYTSPPPGSTPIAASEACDSGDVLLGPNCFHYEKVGPFKKSGTVMHVYRVIAKMKREIWVGSAYDVRESTTARLRVQFFSCGNAKFVDDGVHYNTCIDEPRDLILRGDHYDWPAPRSDAEQMVAESNRVAVLCMTDNTLCQDACANHDEWACARLGALYMEGGGGVGQNLAKAVSILRGVCRATSLACRAVQKKAEDCGDLQSCTAMCDGGFALSCRVAAEQETDDGRAIAKLARACKLGDDESCSRDGDCTQAHEVAIRGRRLSSTTVAVTGSTQIVSFTMCKTLCAQGLPGACLTAASYLAANNHLPEANAARARACQLGVRGACAAPASASGAAGTGAQP